MKKFALVDCNNFYASCEKLFRPDIKNKPVVVSEFGAGCLYGMHGDSLTIWSEEYQEDLETFKDEIEIERTYKDACSDSECIQDEKPKKKKKKACK